ncbi:hypothetical protein IH824_06755, partial [candidate division KSB1 bacterium]|nr:hypothetical protein [candidate division KSB1 bacterium]
MSKKEEDLKKRENFIIKTEESLSLKVEEIKAKENKVKIYEGEVQQVVDNFEKESHKTKEGLERREKNVLNTEKSNESIRKSLEEKKQILMAPIELSKIKVEKIKEDNTTKSVELKTQEDILNKKKKELVELDTIIRDKEL